MSAGRHCDCCYPVTTNSSEQKAQQAGWGLPQAWHRVAHMQAFPGCVGPWAPSGLFLCKRAVTTTPATQVMSSQDVSTFISSGPSSRVSTSLVCERGRKLKGLEDIYHRAGERWSGNFCHRVWSVYCRHDRETTPQSHRACGGFLNTSEAEKPFLEEEPALLTSLSEPGHFKAEDVGKRALEDGT